MRRRRVPVWWLMGTLVGAVLVSVGVALYPVLEPRTPLSLAGMPAPQVAQGVPAWLVRTEHQFVGSDRIASVIRTSGVLRESQSILVYPSFVHSDFIDMETELGVALAASDPISKLTGGTNRTRVDAVSSWRSCWVGAPFRCLWSSRGTLREGTLAVEAPSVDFSTRELPVGVLWPGMIGNVLVYWAVLLGLGSFVRRGRRRLRVRRGRCAGCAYSREGLGVELVCPECGELPA